MKKNTWLVIVTVISLIALLYSLNVGQEKFIFISLFAFICGAQTLFQQKLEAWKQKRFREKNALALAQDQKIERWIKEEWNISQQDIAKYESAVDALAPLGIELDYSFVDQDRAFFVEVKCNAAVVEQIMEEVQAELEQKSHDNPVVKWYCDADDDTTEDDEQKQEKTSYVSLMVELPVSVSDEVLRQCLHDIRMVIERFGSPKIDSESSDTEEDRLDRQISACKRAGAAWERAESDGESGMDSDGQSAKDSDGESGRDSNGYNRNESWQSAMTEEDSQKRKNKIAMLIVGMLCLAVIAPFAYLKYQFSKHDVDPLEQMAKERLPEDVQELTLEYLAVDDHDTDYNFLEHGCGTANQPFLIYTVQDLQRLSNLVKIGAKIPDDKLRRYGPEYMRDAHYRLMQDLTFEANDSVPRIGCKHNTPFSGHFDGGGHTIWAMRFDDLSHAKSQTGAKLPVGLFGYGLGAYIHDLNLKQVNLRTIALKVGCVMTVAESSTVENCTVEASIYSRQHGATVGGVVGWSIRSTINNCSADVKMTIGRNASFVGGVVGYLQEESRMNDCQGDGSIEAVYINDSGVRNNDYYLSDMKIGGVCGVQRDACEVNDCRADVKLTYKGQPDHNYVNDIVGYVTTK